MPSSPQTSERIYERLKADIMGGRFPPRTVLIERALADDYHVSISPVRSAAYRLVGEKLLELHPGGGFHVPDITEEDLRSLYFWHGQLIRNALHARRRRPVEVPALQAMDQTDSVVSPDIAATAAHFFAHIAIQSPIAEHRRAIVAAGERLHAVRLKESLVIGGLEDELRAVQVLTASGQGSDLMTAIWAYHRRRLRRVADLVSAVGGTVNGARPS